MSVSSNDKTMILAIDAMVCAKADDLLRDIALGLKSNGAAVEGFWQRQLTDEQRPCNVELQCLNSKQCFTISQDLGRLSSSCRIDPVALDQLALDMAKALQPSTDLVFTNRFGKREAEGGGFCCVLERAMEFEIPVLTVVQAGWRQALLDYASPWVKLVDNEAEVRRWIKDLLIPIAKS